MGAFGPKDLEAAPCLFCGPGRVHHLYNRAGFRIVQCCGCQFRWVNPRIKPELAPEVYSGRYYKARNTLKNEQKLKDDDFKKSNWVWHLKRIEKVKRPARILDVGCGEGLFLKTAQERGWEVSGVEFSPHAVDIAQNSLGKKAVFCGNLISAKLPSNHFDVVTLMDVVEHLYHPLEDLKEVYRILKPGGMIYLLTPDVSSLYSRILGKFWFEIKPLEHLTYFSQKSLGRLLNKSGFNLKFLERGGKILTFEYIVRILSKDLSGSAKFLKFLTGWTPFYQTPLNFPAGFVIGAGLKPKTKSRL